MFFGKPGLNDLYLSHRRPFSGLFYRLSAVFISLFFLWAAGGPVFHQRAKHLSIKGSHFRLDITALLLLLSQRIRFAHKVC